MASEYIGMRDAVLYRSIMLIPQVTGESNVPDVHKLHFIMVTHVM